MKLAIITPGFKPVPAVNGGAVEQMIQYFIDANEKYKIYDIDLYTIDDPKLENVSYKYTNLIKIPKLPSSRLKVIYKVFTRIRNEYSKVTKKNRIFNFYNDSVRRLYKTNYYDAVLVENIMDNYFAISDKITTEKVYFHLHNQLEKSKTSMITEKKALNILQNVDKFIVVSNFLKDQVKAIDPSKADKLQVVYNAILSRELVYSSKKEQNKLRDKYRISNDDIVFSYIGTLSEAKGFYQFIQMTKKLRYKNNLKFLVVGEKNSKNIDNNYQYENVVFTGYINNNDISKIYSISNCIVIPTQVEETFSVVALESMTMGVPVIASISGGLPEVLSKKCALFIPRNKYFVDNLCDAVLKVNEDNNLRNNMKNIGLERSKLFPQSEKEYFLNLNKVITYNK